MNWAGGVFVAAGARPDDYVNVYNNFTASGGFYDEWAVEDIWRPDCGGAGFCGSNFLGVLALAQSPIPPTLTNSLDPLQMPDFLQATRYFGHFGDFTTSRGFYNGFDSQFQITSLQIRVTSVDEPPVWSLLLIALLATLAAKSMRASPRG